MSLWLQSVIWALEAGDYKSFRQNLLPVAPIPIPDCLNQEFAFAERHCHDKKTAPFFPIRFIWLMEAHEQRMFGYNPLARSHYHPEDLLDLWKRACAEADYQQECAAKGTQFDFNQKAMKLDVGWIYMGDRFI